MGSGFSITGDGGHYHEVVTNLFIGDCYSIYQNKFYKLKKLLIINITNDVEMNKNLPNAKKIRLKIDDDLKASSSMKMYVNLPQITDIIDQHLKSGYVVLVHCVAGRQRSCAAVAAYLMKYRKLSMNTAIELVKRKRPNAFLFGANFKDALIKFQQDLN